MCDMANQIFFKNMKGKGTISWRDTRVTPSDTCDTAFLAHFLKNAFYALSVEWAILTKFTEPNCSTETAVCVNRASKSLSRSP